MDLTKFSAQAGIPYVGSEVIDISSVDHTFTADKGPARALLVTASGNVKFQMDDGSDITLPVAVTSNHYHEIRGYMIRKVYKTSTTATVSYALF